MIDHPMQSPENAEFSDDWYEGRLRFSYNPTDEVQFCVHFVDYDYVVKSSYKDDTVLYLFRRNPNENYFIVQTKNTDFSGEVLFECKTYQEALTYLLLLES
jgi:hypothetical protein